MVSTLTPTRPVTLRPFSSDTTLPTTSVKSSTATRAYTTRARGVSVTAPSARRRPASRPSAWPKPPTPDFRTPRAADFMSTAYHVAEAWPST